MKHSLRHAPAAPTAFGFGARKNWLAQRLGMNQEDAAEIEKGEPVTAPRRALALSRRAATGDRGLHKTAAGPSPRPPGRASKGEV